MHTITRLLILALFFCLAQATQSHAWFWQESPLVIIDGQTFFKSDYQDWWNNWREKGMKFPAEPDEFINWHLLAREAQAMELYLEPVYRKKVDTFLKARSLMLYKQEAIDSKINITDDILWARYEKLFCPRWHLELLYFKDEEVGQKTMDEIQAGSVTFSQLMEGEKTATGPHPLGKKWFRKNLLPEGWLEILSSLKQGEISGPHAMSNGFVIMNLLAVGDPDKEDFESIRDGIRKEEWDEQQAQLTLALFRELKKSYQVEVDEDLLSSLSLEDDPHGEIAEKILVETSNWKISAGEFIKLLSREESFRHSSGFYKGESLEGLKNRVLNSLLSQSLTSLAAVDRHFEEQPPFKAVFQFYTQHRMIKELERRMFQVDKDPDDKLVEQYYQDHIAQFSKPAMVSIAVLEDDEKLGEKIWEEVSRGEDFFAAAAKYYSHHPVAQDIPLKHLEPTVREVVSNLAVGEVSRPFSVGKHTALVKLVANKPSQPIPLDHVKDDIVKKVRKQQFTQMRNEYLGQLRMRSSIEINEKMWTKTKEELGGGKSAK